MNRPIILSDNQYITHMGLLSIIGSMTRQPKIQFAKSKKELIAFLSLSPNAIVIVDYTLFDFGGANELLNVGVRFGDVCWVLFSDELSSEFMNSVLQSSDQISILFKSCNENEISEALQSAFRNERYICHTAANQITFLKSNVQKSHTTLTSTENEVLKEIALGHTTKEIAANRNLSFHTVNTHRKNIFRKLEVNNVYEATKYALRAGIIDLADYSI